MCFSKNRQPMKQIAIIVCLLLTFPMMAQQGPGPVCGSDTYNQLLAQQHPDYAQALAKYTKVVTPVLSQPDGSENADTLITVPVVVHIIHNGEPVGTGQNLSDAQVIAQIEQLNLDFSATNPEFSATPAQWKPVRGTPKIEFCLAGVDPQGNPTTGIVRHQLQVTGTSWTNNNINSEIKPQTIWDPLHYYNVWVLPIPGTTADSGVVGFANYPLPGQMGSNTDGAVIDYRWFGGPGFSQSSYRVLQHETGHYLGLPHPWDGDNCYDDDGIDDTPNVDAPTSEYATLDCSDGYPQGPVSCGNEHMYVNHMDYVTHNCYTSFTQGQANVMRAVLQGTDSGFNYAPRTALAAGAWARCNLPTHNTALVGLDGPADRLCGADSIAPVLYLRNHGTDPLDSLRIYVAAGSGVDTILWQGSLAYGDTALVALPLWLPQPGNFTYTVWTALPDGQPDERPANDTIQVTGTYVAPAPLPFAEDFDNPQWNPTANGVFPFNISGDDFEWQYAAGVSAWGQGSGSALFDNFAGTQTNNPYGTADALITPVFDLSQVNGPVSLAFDLAYAQFSDQLSDTLWIGVSTNCGQLFDQPVFYKGGALLATSGPQSTPFTPTPQQWRTETIDLSAFADEPDLSFAFLNISGWGNRLYIDNIRLILPCGLTVSLSANDASCNGSCDGSLSANATGGWGNLTWSWSAGLPDQPDQSGLCAGAYFLTVTDENGCVAGASIQVQEPAPLTLSLSANGESAAGAHDGSISSNASGGTPPYTYLWSNGATTPAITGLAPGTYTLTLTDANGCTTTASAEVSAYNCGAMSVQLQPMPPSCAGTADGSLTALPAGGNEPYQYLWNTGAQTQTIGGLAAGEYAVTVTGSDGCQATATATLSAPPPLSIQAEATAETAAGAADGTATATATGGTPPYTFTWSNGGSGPQLTNLAPGTYVVTVTDANGCTGTASATVSAGGCSLSLTLDTTPPTCPGSTNGMATASVQGGDGNYTITWSNGQSGTFATGLGEGTWSVTVTDGIGCAETTSFELTASDDVPPTVNAHDVTVWLDASGTATLSPFTALTSATDNCGVADISVSPDLFDCTDLGTTTATLSVTDHSGNVAEAAIQVTVLDGSAPTVTCPPDITVHQCAGPLDYALPQVTDNCTPDMEQLAGPPPSAFFPEGTTSVSWRISDGTGFSKTCTWQITLTYDLALQVEATAPTCAGGADGTASLIATGGQPPYTYDWGGADPAMLSAGTYEVTVTDAAGCSIPVMFTLVDPPPIVLEQVSTTPETNGQADGSAMVQVSGGVPPYEYIWWHNGQMVGSGMTIEGLPAGEYLCQVVDDRGCTWWSDPIVVEAVTATSAPGTRLDFAMWPNPTEEVVYLSGLPEGELRLELCDVQGMVHIRQKVIAEQGQVQLDLSALPSGAYLLSVAHPRGTATRILIRQ